MRNSMAKSRSDQFHSGTEPAAEILVITTWLASMRPFKFLAIAFLALPAFARDFGFPEAQALLKSYCEGCHRGASPAGGFSVAQVATPESLQTAAARWSKLTLRVRNREMPPAGTPALPPEEWQAFLAWVQPALRTAACQNGMAPGAYPMRRLNRDEYAATIRDLLNIHFNAGHALPADGAGGEGFDNAAETLFLSPIHAEKYLEA